MIEQTSKGWKLAMLMGGLGMTAATVVMVVGVANRDTAIIGIGVGVFLLGTVVYGVARVGAWWNHG